MAIVSKSIVIGEQSFSVAVASSGASGRKTVTFDFSAIPEEATVTSVKVKCNTYKTAGNTGFSTSGYCIVYPYGSASTSYGNFNDSTVLNWINQYGNKSMVTSLGFRKDDTGSTYYCTVHFDVSVTVTYTIEDSGVDTRYTVKYGLGYNNEWQKCVVFYGDGGEWKQCRIFYGDNAEWEETTHS